MYVDCITQSLPYIVLPVVSYNIGEAESFVRESKLWREIRYFSPTKVNLEATSHIGQGPWIPLFHFHFFHMSILLDCKV